MIDFMAGDNDWFVEKVFLDEDWIKNETEIWELHEGPQSR